jgi:hypothetical protein
LNESSVPTGQGGRQWYAATARGVLARSTWRWRRRGGDPARTGGRQALPRERLDAVAIIWYEAFALPGERTVRIDAFATRHRKVAECKTRVVNNTALSTLITSGDQHLSIEVQGELTDGQTHLHGQIGEHRFEITGTPTSDVVAATSVTP